MKRLFNILNTKKIIVCVTYLVYYLASYVVGTAH